MQGYLQHWVTFAWLRCLQSARPSSVDLLNLQLAHGEAAP